MKQDIEQLSAKTLELINGIANVVIGQTEVIKEIVCAFLAGGHVLIEGVPGVGKTLLARALALLSGLEFKRIQFTPDLLPADIIGTKVFKPQEGKFEFMPGPVFTDILLADEINRTPPKTQAALLEAMQEKRITVEGEVHTLSSLFFVIATQNPVEYEGTYPLAEAQSDRFMLKVRIGYPNAEDEFKMLQAHNEGFNPQQLELSNITPLLSANKIAQIRKAIQEVKVEPQLLKYLLDIIRATREQGAVLLGASPRAAVALLMASKSMAFVEGRNFIIPDDVKQIAPSVLRHRLILKPEAEMEGVSQDAIIAEVLQSVAVPR